MSEKLPAIKSQALAPTGSSSISQYLQQIGQHPLLSREEEYDLAMRWYNNKDREAAEKLVISNLRFVVKVAREYQKYGFNFLELVQEGNLGLMHAVQKFDPTKGHRLITYSVWWIKAYMQSFILRSWSIVRTGTTRAQRKLFGSLQRARREVAALNPESAPTNAQLAQALDMSEEEFVTNMARIQNRDQSTDAPIASDDPGSKSFGDTLVDTKANTESTLISNQLTHIVKNKLDAIYEELKPRERQILESRLLSDEPKTLDAIGKDFGVTRERVRQIETRLLEKLKVHLLPAVGDAYQLESTT